MEAGRRFVEASKSKINTLENRLAGILKPVAPRREFVNSLNHRIQTIRRPAIVDRFSEIKVTLLVIAGIVSFGLLVGVGIRALVNLLGRKPLSRA